MVRHAPPKIALFANKNSTQLGPLRDILAEHGAIPLLFDLPLGSEAAATIAMGGGRLVWQHVDFADIHVVHVRCNAVNTPAAMPAVMEAATYCEFRARYLREQEYQAVSFSFFDRLVALGKLVINPLTGAYLDHDSKAQLYQKLRAQEFAAPRTLMTNDPERALSFIRDVVEVVAKPAIGIGSTRKITEADLDRLEELRVCPVLIQEYFAGDTIRVHIVGDSVVLAVRIISEGHVDSRTTPTGFEYFKLPDGEEHKIVRANRALGLHFAAWDILATADGRYIYLDCNPGPFIMWIGPEYVRIVLTQLAVYMLSFARTHSVAEASSQVQAWRPH